VSARALRAFHLARACFWLAMVPVVILLGWQTSVFVIFLYSTYANFGADIGAWQASRAEERAE
jgi:uncharacterized RDD family membrane protein YckC